MPARRMPTSFTATRPLSLAGTVLAKGDTIPAHDAVVAVGRKLSSLVSRGWLLPDVPLYATTKRRQGPSRTTPTYSLSARELASL